MTHVALVIYTLFTAGLVIAAIERGIPLLAGAMTGCLFFWVIGIAIERNNEEKQQEEDSGN